MKLSVSIWLVDNRSFLATAATIGATNAATAAAVRKARKLGLKKDTRIPDQSSKPRTHHETRHGGFSVGSFTHLLSTWAKLLDSRNFHSRKIPAGRCVLGQIRRFDPPKRQRNTVFFEATAIRQTAKSIMVRRCNLLQACNR